jgi:hypothetical protein
MNTQFQVSRATPPMRSFAKPKMRRLATRLMTLEAGGKNLAGTKVSAEFSVPDKLRALVLAGVEVPWLRTVRVNAEGGLDGLQTLHARLDPKEYFDGRVVLLSQLLGLLGAFVGEDLTLRLVRNIWPKLSISDSDL